MEPAPVQQLLQPVDVPGNRPLFAVGRVFGRDRARRLASIGAESLRCEALATATRVFGGAFGRGALWARDSVAIANLTSE